jgi:hypothetical protein
VQETIESAKNMTCEERSTMYKPVILLRIERAATIFLKQTPKNELSPHIT